MSITTGILAAYSPVSLAGLNERAGLHSRVELKFVLPATAASALISDLTGSYLMLDIDGRRNFAYTSWYFDTATLRLYHDHAVGYERRIKIRQRLYEDSGLCFFEIKQKLASGYTEKTRLSIPALHHELTATEAALARHPRLHGEALQYTLTNRFHRITLCSNTSTERVTIDSNITTELNGRIMTAGHLVVIEIKQQLHNMHSPAIAALRQAGFHSGPFSKYASGVALLYPAAKYNNLKPTLLKINKYATT